MIRALAALVGFAAAAALFDLAPRAGELRANGLWLVVLVWAAAGLVAGVLYQTGGVRRPGIRANPWLFALVFVPWTAATAGVAAQTSNPTSFLARWMRDLTPGTLLAHWMLALPAFAFGAGLLLAFSFIEPLVGEQLERDEVAAVRPARTPTSPATTPVHLADDTAVRRPVDATGEPAPAASEPADIDTRERTRIVERPTAGNPAVDETAVAPPRAGQDSATRLR